MSLSFEQRVAYDLNILRFISILLVRSYGLFSDDMAGALKATARGLHPVFILCCFVISGTKTP